MICMATDDISVKDQPESTQAGDKPGARETLGDVGRAVSDVAAKGIVAAGLGPPGIVGLSIFEAIKAIRNTRSSVVMARVSKEDLQRLDDLVDCGLVNSRSEAAAFLIAEGIKVRAELFEKIQEHSQLIRNAREEIRRFLGEEPS